MARKNSAAQPASDAVQVKKVSKAGVELGGTGTLITSGIISNADYSAALSGLQGIRAYEQMRNDSTVNASLDVIKLSILAASWYVEAGNDQEEVYEEHAEFVRKQMKGLEGTFSEFLREGMNYLDYGRYVFEIVYKLTEDGKIGWAKFAPRMPQTIYYWQTENGKPGIQQVLPGGGKPSIPLEKLILFTNRKEGDNHEGRSVLRTSYRNWYTKDALYKIQAIALERQGVGIPYVKVPKGATKANIIKAEEFLRNLRANEEAYLTWKDGWEFGFLDMHANNMNPEQAISHHNREIVKNVLAQFLELGSGGSKGGSSGSFALSKDQSKLFILSLQYVATYMAEIITKQAIQRLIEINFGPQEYYPQLKVSKITDIDASAIASALSQLVTAGLITVDEGLEDHLRNVMNLPELPDEVRAENEFNALLQQTDEQDAALQMQEDAMDAQDMTQEDQTMQDEGNTMQASENDVTLGEVIGVVFTGAAGVPLSEEHRNKISEALKAYWATRKTHAPVKKGKRGKGGSSSGKKKLSEQEKAMKKEKATQVKALRTARKAEVKKLRSEFRKKKFAMREKVMQLKIKGEKPSKEDYARMQMEILKAQSAMLDRIDKIDVDTDKKVSTITGSEAPHMPSVLKMKEEVDNAIARLETITGAA